MGYRDPVAARRARSAGKRGAIDAGDVARRYITARDDGTYSVDFPRHFGIVSKGPVELYGLEKFPNLAEPLADGYTLHGLSVESADRRYYLWQQTRSGFLDFLKELPGGAETKIGDIDEALLKDFKRWLDDPESDGFAPSELTRRIKIQDIQLILRQLMASKRWAPLLSPKLKLLQDLYPGAHRRVKHTDILDDVTLEHLYVAAASDCEAIMKRVQRDDERLVEALTRRVDLRDAGRNQFLCGAYMLQNFEHPFPSHHQLRSADFQRAVSIDVYRRMQRLLYPTLEELLPFILLLAIMFAFNPGVVLNMTHDDYEPDTLFGRERIRVKPFKPRSHRNQVNTVLATDDSDNPKTIFAFLESRTLALRPMVRPDFANRVFVRFSPKVNRPVAVEMSDEAMRAAIRDFCERHADFEPFRLEQIRPTTLDLVHEISGGNIVAMQQVANHESADTTKDYYTSAAFQRRNEEMLAAGMAQLERKYRSSGKIDPPARHRLRVDLGSATPGFACLDPRDAPFRDQKRGELCTAYGRCPICPLAMVDPGSEHSFAYLLKLKKALDEAAGRLGAPWYARWGAVSERLTTFWSRLFVDEEVRRKGFQMAELAIPDLPQLD